MQGMKTLPNLDGLSHTDKDELIRALFAQANFLTAQVATLIAQATQVEILTAKVAELEGRLALNSHNSSKPPSSDGFNKPKSLRVAGQNSSGGQAGHQGHTLKKVVHPDHTEQHRPPAQCASCLRLLDEGTVVETRQVFDIPPCVLKSLNIRCWKHAVLAVKFAVVFSLKLFPHLCNMARRSRPLLSI